MSTTCNFKTSEASTKAWFKTNGLIDKSLNIVPGALAKFRNMNTKWSEYANKTYGIQGRLFIEEDRGRKALPNKRMFHMIDVAKGIFYPENEYLSTSVKTLPTSNINDYINDVALREQEEREDTSIPLYNAKYGLSESEWLSLSDQEKQMIDYQYNNCK